MMTADTTAFRTKSVARAANNSTVEGYWPIAMDVGYSSVKCYSPDLIVSFPAYARNLGENPRLYGSQEDDEILYRDGETGKTWRVGRSAQRMVDERDTGDARLELFGRDRYYSKMFQVLVRTGMALTMMDKGMGTCDGKTMSVQTGLPPAYLDEDREALSGVIAGRHRFSLQTKGRRFTDFDFTVEPEDVYVMSQPEGTLMSIATGKNGENLPESRRYFQSNVLIFDAGFGTLDLFDIVNRTVHSRETFPEFGMKAVLDRTAAKIKAKTGMEIRASAMQNLLESGKITVKKRRGMEISSRTEPFGDMLAEASAETCRAAVEKIMNIYSGLFSYDYLILTGGTSAAWERDIRNYFKDVEGLAVVMGNANYPDMDMIFCNVRGYYVYLINVLRRKIRGGR